MNVLNNKFNLNLFLLVMLTLFLTSSGLFSKSKRYKGKSIDKIIMKDYLTLKHSRDRKKKLTDRQYRKLILRERRILKHTRNIKKLRRKKYKKRRYRRYKKYNRYPNSEQDYDPSVEYWFHPSSKKSKLFFREKEKSLNSKAFKNYPFRVSLNTKHPKQGTTLVIFIHTSSPAKIIAGRFGRKKLVFSKLDAHTFRALVGLDVAERPGKKKLTFIYKSKNRAKPILYSNYLTVKKRYVYKKIVKRKKKRRRRKKKGIIVKLPKAKRYLLTYKGRHKESLLFRRQFKKISRKQYWEGHFALPIRHSKKYIKSFGRYRSYVGRYIIKRSYHRGVDIPKPKGTSVSASNRGVVVIARHYNIRGNAVVINHGMGVYSCYFHLSKIKVKKGQLVKKKDIIGEVGTTGLSTGNHLHWELRIHGVSVNPKEWCSSSLMTMNMSSSSNLNKLTGNKFHDNKISVLLDGRFGSNKKPLSRSRILERLKTIDRFN